MKNANPDIYVIVVAGGSGQRFGSEVPKQFLPLAGEPVLLRTVKCFEAVATRIVVALPERHIAQWKSLCEAGGYRAANVAVVAGGESRYHSVANALATLPAAADDAIVLVHDGVRPLVPRQVISDAVAAAVAYGAAVPVVPLIDSIRHLDEDGGTTAVPRAEYVAVQTPQAFRLGLLREAYAAGFSPLFTDDASVVEAAGGVVARFAGAPANIKITYPDDLLIAAALLSHR